MPVLQQVSATGGQNVSGDSSSSADSHARQSLDAIDRTRADPSRLRAALDAGPDFPDRHPFIWRVDRD